MSSVICLWELILCEQQSSQPQCHVWSCPSPSIRDRSLAISEASAPVLKWRHLCSHTLMYYDSWRGPPWFSAPKLIFLLPVHQGSVKEGYAITLCHPLWFVVQSSTTSPVCSSFTERFRSYIVVFSYRGILASFFAVSKITKAIHLMLASVFWSYHWSSFPLPPRGINSLDWWIPIHLISKNQYLLFFSPTSLTILYYSFLFLFFFPLEILSCPRSCPPLCLSVHPKVPLTSIWIRWNFMPTLKTLLPSLNYRSDHWLSDLWFLPIIW